MMLSIAFWFTAVLVTLLLLVIAVSVMSPAHRIWPPAGQKTWQFVFVWSSTLLVAVGIIIVGLLDWNNLEWHPIFRWITGCGLVIIGNGLALAGVARLGVRATSGAEDELVATGVYRYTRNPQYLGAIFILLGWFIWSASIWVFPLIIGGTLAFALAPLAEESWLAEVYGPPYRAYREKVPRFLPRIFNGNTS